MSTRQQKWQRRQYLLGNCINCGKPRGDSPYKRFCSDCGMTRRRLKRKYTNSSAWKEGGPGRMPYVVDPSNP